MKYKNWDDLREAEKWEIARKEAFKECDQTEAESSETVSDDLLARELDPERIEAIKGRLRAFIGIGDYNYPGNPAYGDAFVLRDLQSKYSPVEIQEARR